LYDVLLVLPPVGPNYIYSKPRGWFRQNDFTNYKWILRLTRVPQGLLSIGTVLDAAGYTVKIIDCRLHLNNLENYLREHIKATRLFVGISVLTMQIQSALGISKLTRRFNPDLPVVWGGYHPTLYPEQTVRDELVDFVVVGEGEEPLLKLASSLENSSWNTKNNRNNNNNKILGAKRPFEINSLPTPNYELLETEAYLTKRSYNPERDVRGIEYTGSRGCCYNCAFCVNGCIPQKRVWRGKNPEKIYEDLTYLKQKYGLEYVFFEEELPFLDRKRALKLCDYMEKLDLFWYANIRVDIAAENPDLLRRAYEAGWRETSVGAESGSNRILQMLRKGITAEQTLKVAETLNELGVYCLYSFMTDLPSETLKDRNATWRLMRQLRRIHPKSEFIGPQTYRPYPKTELYNQLVNDGRFREPETLREWVISGLVRQFS